MTELVVDNAVAHYGRSHTGKAVLHGVSLTVPSRATLGLVGESGCGKSTLARAITRLIPLAAGDVRLEEKSIIRGASRRELRRRARGIQLVFQDPRASLNPRMTVGETLTEALRVAHQQPRAELVHGAAALLDRVGIREDALGRYPHEFSGGQLQRVAIARAIATRPRVLVADEPTSSLDVSVQATVLNLLKELQHDLGFSLLFISHNLAVVRYMSDRIAVMYAGRIVEEGDPERILEMPRHPYTATLIASVPGTDSSAPLGGESGHIPDTEESLDCEPACPYASLCPRGPTRRQGRDACLSRDPFAPSVWADNGCACHFPLTQATTSALRTSATGR